MIPEREVVETDVAVYRALGCAEGKEGTSVSFEEKELGKDEGRKLTIIEHLQ